MIGIEICSCFFKVTQSNSINCVDIRIQIIGTSLKNFLMISAVAA